jgi:Fe-S-cluster containining protein
MKMILELSDQVFKKYVSEFDALSTDTHRLKTLAGQLQDGKLNVRLIEATQGFILNNPSFMFHGAALLVHVTDWMRSKPKREMTLFVNKVIDHFVELHRVQYPNVETCRKGCSFCCYQQVQVTEPEGQILSDLIKKDPSIVSMKRLALHKSWQKNEKGSAWTEPDFSLRRCPFLSDDNLCNVYKHRPAACRNHRSIDPPHLCDEKAIGNHPIRFINQFEIGVLMNALVNLYDLKPMAHSIN